LGIVAPDCHLAEKAAAEDVQLPIVLVQIDKTCYKNKTFTLSNFQGETTPNVVPIAPINLTFKYQNQKIVRTQVPLMLSSCITIHKCQSLTVDNLVWVLGKLFERGLPYIPPGRVTSSEGLYIVKTIEKSELTITDMNKFQTEFYDIHREYERLRTKQRLEARRIAESTAVVARLPEYSESMNTIKLLKFLLFQRLKNTPKRWKKATTTKRKRPKRENKRTIMTTTAKKI